MTVLSFFCLGLLYFITLASSATIVCKFANFIPEARIAKVFYVSIVVVCLVRSACFGVATGVFAGGEEFQKFGRLPDGKDGKIAEIKVDPSEKFLQLNGYNTEITQLNQNTEIQPLSLNLNN